MLTLLAVSVGLPFSCLRSSYTSPVRPLHVVRVMLLSVSTTLRMRGLCLVGVGFKSKLVGLLMPYSALPRLEHRFLHAPCFTFRSLRSESEWHRLLARNVLLYILLY